MCAFSSGVILSPRPCVRHWTAGIKPGPCTVYTHIIDDADEPWGPRSCIGSSPANYFAFAVLTLGWRGEGLFAPKMLHKGLFPPQTFMGVRRGNEFYMGMKFSSYTKGYLFLFKWTNMLRNSCILTNFFCLVTESTHMSWRVICLVKLQHIFLTCKETISH